MTTVTGWYGEAMCRQVRRGMVTIAHVQGSGAVGKASHAVDQLSKEPRWANCGARVPEVGGPQRCREASSSPLAETKHCETIIEYEDLAPNVSFRLRPAAGPCQAPHAPNPVRLSESARFLGARDINVPFFPFSLFISLALAVPVAVIVAELRYWIRHSSAGSSRGVLVLGRIMARRA